MKGSARNWLSYCSLGLLHGEKSIDKSSYFQESYFSYKDLIPTLLLLEPKLIFRSYAILDGMSGCITGTSWLSFHFRKSVLDNVLDLLRMKGMSWRLDSDPDEYCCSSAFDSSANLG